ncbi:MAG: metal-dependent transcriptional regulator [Candidatus Kapaibacterium sp.]
MSTPSIEDYVKAIYKAESLGEVSSQDIAKRVGVSAPAVSKMLRKLQELHFVKVHPKTGIHLTSSGRKTALQTIRRHRLLELYLVKELGYRWDEVHDEAEKLEHHISPLFEERIAARLGHPEFDPHGDPIPTAEGNISVIEEQLLSSLRSPHLLVISRIVDRDPELLRYVADLHLLPGTQIEFLGQEKFGGSYKLKVGKKSLSLPPEAARQIFARLV